MSIKLPDVRQLRQFVAVAEHLHFARAARELNISQPPLTRAIQELERKVGAELLQRTRRRVELTPAGAELLGAAKRILAELVHAVERVRSVGEGAAGSLRIGFVPLADYGLVPSLISAHKARHPGIALSLREMLTPQQQTALELDELDLGILVGPMPAKGFQQLVVQRDRFVVAIPARHALGQDKAPMPALSLAREPFVAVPREYAPRLHDIVTAIAHRAGFEPKIAQEAIQMQTVVSLVAAGLGVALVPQSVASVKHKGVKFRPLKDRHDSLELSLTWKSMSPNGAVRDFVCTARPSEGV